MNSAFHIVSLLGISLGASISLHAQSKFGNGGGDGRWSNPVNWMGSGGRYPSGAGVEVEMSTKEGQSTLLDVEATVGSLRNEAGSARVWTITNQGDFTLTLDNTGRVNSWGNQAAEIRVVSSGGIVGAMGIRLINTDLDIGTVGSNNPGAQITLSGPITATSNQTITIRNNRRQTVLQGDIGMDGSGDISLCNLSSGTPGDSNQLVIAGNLGARVVELMQGEGICEGMVVGGANRSFRGRVFVLANTITVLAGATLGDFNTIRVANGARLRVGGAAALGNRAGLEIDHLGGLILNYTGTRAIDALSFDGGMTFAAPGEVWGCVGSGAQFESAQINGTGLLQVVPGSDAAGVADVNGWGRTVVPSVQINSL